MKRDLFKINARGELINLSVLDDISEKYKPDSLFLKGCAPYIIMAICASIDGSFFYALFSMLSYDNPFILSIQILAFLVGFDLLPVYAGVIYKKLKCGLTTDKRMLRLALGVCALICAANIGLRVVTVDLAAPNSQLSFTQALEEPAEEENSADPVAWMNAVMGMILPVVTSVCSFVVSNACYEPLLIRKEREEKMICRKADKIRRLNTMIRAYEADQDLGRKLLEDDEKQYEAARAMTEGLLLEYQDYIRQRLITQLQDPAATSLLSVPAEDMLLDQLKQLCEKRKMPVPRLETGE